MTRTRPAGKQVPLRVDVEPAIHAVLKEHAIREDLSIAQILRRALREYLEKAA